MVWRRVLVPSSFTLRELHGVIQVAMGGEGTMGRWYHAQPRLVSADFMHPMPAGAAIVGGLFESALVKSYEDSSR